MDLGLSCRVALAFLTPVFAWPFTLHAQAPRPVQFVVALPDHGPARLTPDCRLSARALADVRSVARAIELIQPTVDSVHISVAMSPQVSDEFALALSRRCGELVRREIRRRRSPKASGLAVTITTFGRELMLGHETAQRAVAHGYLVVIGISR
jgi:hypothetical protein